MTKRRLPGTGSLLVAATATIVTLGLWDGGPNRLRDRIPYGVPTTETLFYQTRWFRCAVSVFKVEEQFVRSVREEGVEVLSAALSAQSPNDQTADHYKRWSATPVALDMSKATGNLLQSKECLSDTDRYAAMLENYMDSAGGYYAINERDGTALLAPAEGVLFVGGYE